LLTLPGLNSGTSVVQPVVSGYVLTALPRLIIIIMIIIIVVAVIKETVNVLEKGQNANGVAVCVVIVF
jgi:hypothetical protein